MPTLDDLPTLAAVFPTGDDLLPIYDLTGNGSSKVRKISVNQIGGLSADSVTTGGTSAVQTAVVAPILTGTAVTGWNITNGGIYSSAPTITLSGTGTATFTGTITNGVLTSVSTTAATGTNSFSGAPTVAVTASTFYEEVRTRLVYGVAATSQLTFPPVAGPLRYFTVIKNGAGTCTVTRHPANTGNIILSGTAAAGTSATIATTAVATFVSDGTNWYRVTSTTA
jgi:hypothetical protein